MAIHIFRAMGVRSTIEPPLQFPISATGTQCVAPFTHLLVNACSRGRLGLEQGGSARARARDLYASSLVLGPSGKPFLTQQVRTSPRLFNGKYLVNACERY